MATVAMGGIKETESRERILKKIRNALISRKHKLQENVDLVSNVYVDETEPAEIAFAHNFTALQGKFSFCLGEEELITALSETAKTEKWSNVFCREPELRNLLEKAGIVHTADDARLAETQVAVTGCEYLVGRFGAVMVSSKQASGRKLPVYTDKHVVIAYTHQTVLELKDAYSALKEKYAGGLPSLISLIAGPSRSADIEKTLVVGAHGAKEIYVFLTEKS